MQTATVIPFQFKTTEVRTIEIDNQIWFIASDIAKALRYRDAANMIRMLDDDEMGTHNVSTSSSNRHGDFDRDVDAVIINESGLYHAILKSRKPEAVPFRKWVTGEVLPAIRKTGRYEAPQVPAVPIASTRDINQLAWRTCHGMWPEMVAALSSQQPVIGMRRLLVTVDDSQHVPMIGVYPVPVTAAVIDSEHLDKLRNSARDAAAVFMEGMRFDRLTP